MLSVGIAKPRGFFAAPDPLPAPLLVCELPDRLLPDMSLEGVLPVTAVVKLVCALLLSQLLSSMERAGTAALSAVGPSICE
jgi:hypothetical protein